jgi:uncharacterized protein (TIGR00369 family)
MSAHTETTLQRWLDEEAVVLAQRELGLRQPHPDRAHWASRPGIEFMQAMVRGEATPPSIGHTLDFWVMEVTEGQAVFQGRPGAAHMNPLGTIHGGWFATILDSALGCAVHSRMPPGHGYTTAELSVNIVKALTPKVQRVRAVGHVLHCGRKLATAEAKLTGPDGTLYAHATTTCLVFELPKA